MTKFVIKNVANNKTVTHESDAETWGALQDEIMEVHGTDIVRPGMKAVLRSNRNELAADSQLPSDDEVKINLFATNLENDEAGNDSGNSG